MKKEEISNGCKSLAISRIAASYQVKKPVRQLGEIEGGKEKNSWKEIRKGGAKKEII